MFDGCAIKLFFVDFLCTLALLDRCLWKYEVEAISMLSLLLLCQ
jgi:hypothetical protein